MRLCGILFFFVSTPFTRCFDQDFVFFFVGLQEIPPYFSNIRENDPQTATFRHTFNLS